MTLKDLDYELIEKDGRYYYKNPLNLFGTEISTLPDNLTVRGFLNLTRTKITSLPDNLVIGGGLDLRYTKITSLPNNLVISGFLDIRDTNITTLPDNLVIGGNLYINGTTNITCLPDNLMVGGSLDLEGTKMTSLPDNLIVGRNIYFNDTRITREEVNRVSHNIPKVLFWGNKEYVKVEGLSYRVLSNKGNVFEIYRIVDDRIIYLITNTGSKYAIGDRNNLDKIKMEYNLLNIKKS